MKQTRLLEIIREEIASALNEAGLFTLKVPTDTKKGLPQTTDPDDSTEKSPDFLKKYKKVAESEVELEEGQLDEIEQLAEMASMVQLKNQLEKQGKSDELEAVRAAEQTTIDKLKANPEFSGDGKNIRLKGYVKNLKKELKDTHGIDLQVLLSQVAAQAEKAGEDFKDDIATNTIEKNAAAQILGTEKSKPGPQTNPNKPKSEPKAKAEKAPKAKPAAAPKAEPEDSEDKEATQNVNTDKTAKDLGNLATGKEETFNRILGLIDKYKDNKAVVDAFISKAENEYKLPASLLNQLKRTAGREVKA